MNEIKKQNTKKSTLRKMRGNLALSQTDTGKLPPQAIDLEESVLGAMMLEKEAVTAAIDILSPESFYKDEHKKIYSAIYQLYNDSKPIDILTVTEELKKRGDLDFVGGPYYISQLTNRIASSANVEFHSRIISQKYILRELINISSDTIHNAFDDTTDVFDLLDNVEKELFKITEGHIRRNYVSMSLLINESIDLIAELAKKEDIFSGIPSGFAKLDKITGGFQKSDLIIIAARPSMGKTAFVLSCARNIAVDFKKPVAFFSLEMSSRQLVTRMMSSEAEINSQKLRNGELAEYEWAQLHEKIANITEAPIFIDDTSALSIFELRAKCRRLKSQHDIQLIIIDYLQLMTANNDKNSNREQEISTISRSLKTIAKELDVPVIALSQLNRPVEVSGGTKRPQLSLLRESGAIEQDADVVGFIYRPEQYEIYQWEDGTSSEGQAEIDIKKHRNGALGKVRLQFIKNFAKFVDLEDSTFRNTNPDEFLESKNQNSVIIPSKMDDISDDDL